MRNDRASLVLVICAVLPWSGCMKQRAGDDFVRMGEHGFVVDGHPFFPLAINYIASIRAVGDSLWIGPSANYASFDTLPPPSRSAHLAALRADMQLIHDLGFNTVRIVGFADQLFENDSLWFSIYNGVDRDTVIKLDRDGNYERYLDAIGTMLDAVRAAGLRAILLTQLRVGRPINDAHFARIADRFAKDTVVMAYDLFNEPLYFDRPERPKEEAHAILQHWRELFDAHAPDQLYTLGLTGIRETFEFDPNMLGVDFISYHPYEYEPDQVRNEMRWYHNNVDVPWIIGETAIPADDDSVPYAEQARFAERTLTQSRACGAIGYSWWQYQDVRWNRFHADYMGVVNRQGATLTSSGAIAKGTPKPVAEVFKHFDPNSDPGECLCLPNYLNYSEGRVCKITGRLVDPEGRPINEGTIIAWNEEWTSSYHTTSDAEGRFELRGAFWLYHWMASATRYGMVRGDADPNAYSRGADGMPAFFIGELELEPLSFATAPLRNRAATAR